MKSGMKKDIFEDFSGKEETCGYKQRASWRHKRSMIPRCAIFPRLFVPGARIRFTSFTSYFIMWTREPPPAPTRRIPLFLQSQFQNLIFCPLYHAIPVSYDFLIH